MTDAFLNTRRALVTGGTSGIGLAIAQALAKAGCQVTINGLGNPEQIAQALAGIQPCNGQTARFIDADLRDAAAVERMMDTFGAGNRLDILVNCAGMQIAKPIAEMPASDWDTIIAVNLSAAFHSMRLALPAMAEQGFGRVINITSGAVKVRISGTYPLSEAANAHRDLEGRRTTGKLLLKVLPSTS